MINSRLFSIFSSANRVTVYNNKLCCERARIKKINICSRSVCHVRRHHIMNIV